MALTEDGTLRLEGETAGVSEFLDGQLIRTGPILAGHGVFETADYVYIVNEEKAEEPARAASESSESGLPEQK